MRYYEIPNPSSDAPKVRLQDVVLNILPKTGIEEVPPRRDEHVQNLRAKTEILNIVEGFEGDIYKLNHNQSLHKCESIFASLSDQN